MVNLTPNQIELIPAREKIIMPELDMATLVGGWLATQSELRKGNVNIQANKERILFGNATAPLTGVGIFLGKDDSDYEFRIGDPSGNYFHYDGTNITVVGGAISAGTITGVTITGGSIEIKSNGTIYFKVSATGVDNLQFSGAGTPTLSSPPNTLIEIRATKNSYIDFSTPTTSDLSENRIDVRRNANTASNSLIYVEAGNSGVASNAPLVQILNAGSEPVLKLQSTNAIGHNPHIIFTGDPGNSDPADGDLWFDGADLKIRIGATTYTLDKTSV